MEGFDFPSWAWLNLSDCFVWWYFILKIRVLASFASTPRNDGMRICKTKSKHLSHSVGSFPGIDGKFSTPGSMKSLIYSVWMFSLPGCQLKSLTWAKEKQPSWWSLVPAQSRNLSKIHPISFIWMHFCILSLQPLLLAHPSIFSFDIWLHHGEAEEKETQARYFSGLFWSVVGVPPPDFLVLQDAIGPSQRAALSVPLAWNRWIRL